ncbi:MAG: RDD family protein [Gemmatimonadota bacterium]
MTEPADPNAEQPPVPGTGQPPASSTGEPQAQEAPPPAGGSLPAAPPVTGYGQPAVAGVPAGMYIHQESGLILPEGVQLASIGRRVGAYFLAIPLSIVTLGIGYIVWGLIVWGRGQTPALQVLGMRCWRPDDGRVASWGWMALREIVGRIAEGILSIITLLLSFILMVTSKERKSLHDLVAGTVVLYDPDKILAA